MISEHTRNIRGGLIVDRELDNLRVKCKPQPISVYEVIGRTGEMKRVKSVCVKP